LIFGALAGCSSRGDENAADTASTDPDAESSDADVTNEASDTAGDSIPMTVAITLPSLTEGPATYHGGTFRGEGKGAQCENTGNGWSVLHPGTSDSLGIGAVRLNVGKLTAGKTNIGHVMAVAGSLQMKGMGKTQLIHIISSGEPGPQPAGSAPSSGSGTATMTREGQRVRFEIDGTSGTTGKSFKMTLVCEREGKWV